VHVLHDLGMYHFLFCWWRFYFIAPSENCAEKMQKIVQNITKIAQKLQQILANSH